MPPVAGANTCPASCACGVEAQTVKSAPAFALGAGVNVITTLSTACKQFPFPVLTRVRVMFPDATSANVGV